VISRGILGGSRTDFENLNSFLEEKKVKLDPLIDRIFSFEEAPEAYRYLASGKHVGKIVIKIS
jgi:threonine dehydrogenase-like Zn-dependent dehydrogenase